MKKGIFGFFLALIFVAVANTATVYAIDILFEHRSTQQLGRGVVYEQNRMMTSRGMLDVHVLTVNMDEPYVSLRPVISSRELGLRETTSRLLSDAGAVAGINADFFNMTRAHSTYFGPMVYDGRVISLHDHTNAYGDEFSALFLDFNNNPFFRYMRTRMHLYVDGRRSTSIAGYNSVGATLPRPVVVSRVGMYCTAAIDARMDYITKVVVENNIVTHFSGAGETVYTPEDGFVILIPADMRTALRGYFGVGTRVDFYVGTDIMVDFSRIQAAIGGGGTILSGGELVAGRGVAPNHRHPRTAVGVTRDGRVLLMVVDGRTHSIGVTHAELGAILQRYGAVDAIHMDGGGSTTMVTRSDAGVYSVANTLPGGAQRRVTNALGVFNNAPIGAMTHLVLEMAEDRAIAGVPMPGEIFGTDLFGNRIALTIHETDEECGEDEYCECEPPNPFLFRPIPVFIADPEAGFWYDGRYTPLRTGRHEISVWYGTFHATAEIYAFSLGELQPRPESISLLEGGRARLRFSGTATDGTHVYVPEVTGLTVSPAYLGAFDGNYFVALRGGAGHIAVAVGDVRAYIPVTVGGFPQDLNMLGTYIGFYSIPYEYVTGSVSVEHAAGQRIPRMDYEFSRTYRTQAAYMTFYPPIAIPGEPIALRMQAYGDGSGHWMRGRVRDADGEFHNIDFARIADFVGWETVTAMLPDAPAPFEIDRLYMVTLEAAEPSRHMVLFHGLHALYAPAHTAEVPRGTVFQDRLRAHPTFNGVPGGGHQVFNIPNADTPTQYSALGWNNFAVIQMTARGGGIAAGEIEQWRQFMPNIRAIDADNVLILLDHNPLSFSRRMEFELFHLAMTELRDEGRRVFVVSATVPYENGEPTLTMREGIRYINMLRPESGNANINIWTDGDNVWWN